MNSHYVELTQQGKKLSLSHHQLDRNKLLINLPMLLITLCHALTSYFVQTSNYGVDVSIFSVTIISFMLKLTFVFPSHLYMSVKPGIIIRHMLKILKKQCRILIGTRPLRIFL